MGFSSISFLFYFLPPFFLVYYLVPRRLKNITALLGSLAFYAWGEPTCFLLIAAATLANYGLGLWMRRARRLALAFGLTLDLGLLFLSKYLGFFAGIFGADITALPLPLGLSFFVFQALSYQFDVFRGTVEPERRVDRFALYLLLFPRVMQGPLTRYEQFCSQLDDRPITADGVGDGCLRFAVGLAKKLLLANSLGSLADRIWGTPDAAAATAWLGLLAYTMQIYFDFGGYTDMAIGLGRMMGFQLPENFNYPYLCRSVSEFWRRWHITLGQWFRDYVYFPLGGSRVGRLRLVCNLLVVWTLTGFWHGANWTFLLWGLYFGLLLCAEKLLCLEKRRIPAILRHGFCLLAVMLGWVLFRSASIGEAAAFLGRLFGRGGALDPDTLLYLHDNALLLLVGAVGCTPLLRVGCARLSRRFPAVSAALRAVAVLALLAVSTVCLANSNYQPFLYLRF